MSDKLTEEHIAEISDALAGGRKIEAIKIYREATEEGLKEAKDFIEALTPKLKEQDPEKYDKLSDSQGGGCASAALLCVSLAVAVLFWIARA